jgi:hypothetical protein
MSARPDELAMCFALAALLLLRHPPHSWGRIAASGILFGLSAATITGVTILLGMIAFVWIALDSPSLPRTILASLLWGLTATLALAAALAPILIACPDAYKQYLAHAGDQFGRGRYLESYLWSWRFGRPYLALTASCLIIAAASLGIARDRFPRREWLRLWLGPLVGLLFLAICVPRKYHYLWILGPWLLIAAGICLYQLSGQLRPSTQRLLLAGLLIGYGFAAGPFLKNTLAMLALPEAQALAPNAQAMRALIPSGSTVMTDDYWWVLADHCRVRDNFYSHPRPEEIEFIILPGNASGDPNLVRQVPPYLADYVRDHFVPIANNINQQPLSVLGVRLPNTAFGFGVLVLRRADRAYPG